MFEKFEPPEFTASSTKIETQNNKEPQGNLSKPNEHIPGGFLYHHTTSIPLSTEDKQNVFGHIAKRIQQTRQIILFRYILHKSNRSRSKRPRNRIIAPFIAFPIYVSTLSKAK